MHALRRCSRVIGLFALATALTLSGSCNEPEQPKEWSVILVTIDTIRADRIGVYGGTAVPTPNLDRIAAEGTLFEDAHSTTPLTLPSHATMLTGRYPASHGVRHNGVFRLGEAETTLAEALQAAGFETAAFIGAFVLNRGFGLEQGFDLYVDFGDPRGRDPDYLRQEALRTADEVNARVFEWLKDPPDGRFLAWVHYFDPHMPYRPPESAGRELHGLGYDREISYVDAALGDLLRELETTGLLKRSILGVAGDHGESLGEHGEGTHGIFLYESSMHVPLILRAPGLVPAGHRAGGPASIVDLAPTLLDLLDLPPLPHTQGRSLVPRIEGREDGESAVVFAESLMARIDMGWSELRMARDRRFKYVQAPREELYDLIEDPEELHNLAEIEVERTRAMAALVETWIEETTETGTDDARRDLSPDELERLQSLGYLGGDAAGAVTGIDPKDGLALTLGLDEARLKSGKGDHEGAVVSLRSVLKDDPTNRRAVSMMLGTLVTLGRYGEAEAVAREALDAAMASPHANSRFLRQTRLHLAALYRRQGRDAEARNACRQALEGWVVDDSWTAMGLEGIQAAVGAEPAMQVFEDLLESEPRHPIALEGSFRLRMAAGDTEASIRAAERFLTSGSAPDLSGPLLVDAGRFLLDGGRPEPAVELLRIAVAKIGPQADLLGYLGTALLSAGRLDEAEAAFEEAGRLRPTDPRPHFYLGNIALLRNDEQRARRHFEDAGRADSEFTEPLDNLALWLTGQGRTDEAVEVLREALERNPEDPRARDLMRNLNPEAGE